MVEPVARQARSIYSRVSVRSPRRGLVTTLVPLALLGGVLGCSGGSGPGSTATPCPSPTPAPADQLALAPSGLSFDEVGTVTRVVATDGHVMLDAVTTLPLDEATVRIQDAVTAAGYRPAGMDNEGFEAEVFFVSGTYAAGQALVRRGTCEGTWDVELVLIDPSAVPSPSAT